VDHALEMSVVIAQIVQRVIAKADAVSAVDAVAVIAVVAQIVPSALTGRRAKMASQQKPVNRAQTVQPESPVLIEVIAHHVSLVRR
jgi:hypothetical protein